MPTSKLKNQLQLHFIVFIWGFTAILGALISITAIPLVWYRVLLAVAALFIYFKWKKISFKVSKEGLVRFFIGGVIIAIHWVTFFHAIKISNVSTTLVTMSTAAIFVAFFDPLINKRKILKAEIILAGIAMVGFFIIFKVNQSYLAGIISALISAVLIAFFSIFNGRNIQKYEATQIAFYELLFANLFLGLVILIQGDFSLEFFNLSTNDWLYLLLLGTICTAYPFVVSTNLLKKMSPFTIVLTTNLEPVYGILLAILIFGDKEKMEFTFYIGAFLILTAVIINALYLAKRSKKL